MKGEFFLHKNVEFTDLGGGVKRKIIGYTDDIMVTYVTFEKGAIGEAHIHDIHDQIGYVLSGKFEVTNGGVAQVLEAGDAFIAPKHILHGAVCLEAGVLIDTFTPKRDDFLE